MSAVRSVLASSDGADSIAVLAVTGSMQNLALARRYGEMAAPQATSPTYDALLDDGTAIMYSDSRALHASHALSESLGVTVEPTSLVAKLAHLRAQIDSSTRVNDANPGARRFVLGAADAVLYGFGGDLVTDPTTASTTGLTLPPHRSYDEELLVQAGLENYLSMLPAIRGGEACGAVSAEVAEALEAPQLINVPLVHAGGDAASATFAAGCDCPENGQYLYFGTTGWVGGSVYGDGSLDSTQLLRRASGVFYLGHVSRRELSIELGSLSSAGACLSWAAREILGGVSVYQLLEMAQQSTIGSNGATFAPWLAGRRCPFPNARASAGFVGLSSSTTKNDIARACIEGVVFSYRSCFELVRHETASEQIVRPKLGFIGGGARSEFLASVFASALNCDIVMQSAQYAGVVGAARFATQTLPGLNTNEWNMNVMDGLVVPPQSSEQEQYERAYARWMRVAQKL